MACKCQVFDPYQVFQVQNNPCVILTVKVVRGRNVTKGWMDTLDTPDPYVLLQLKTSPEGRRRTETKDNDVNPEWNEEFTFLIDENENNILQIILMEANYGYGKLDQVIGEVFFRLREVSMNKRVSKIFYFNEKTEVKVEFEKQIDENPTLRYSLCLCDEEKEFLDHRTQKVQSTMKELFGDQAPETTEQTPRIAVIGSGGGFRAMVGMSGVVKALADSKILDCVTYMGGLSGSTWYISTLYSHKDWPEKNPCVMQEELKHSIDSSFLWLLEPGNIVRYLVAIGKKRMGGQPVSLIDLFGLLIGETLLKDRLDVKLSDLKDKVEGGKTPLPLMTCVNVKTDRSAKIFQEWVEFSPYEIGMPKYGAFMKTEHFGSKFFMGKLCKEYDEQPLHFLQGIWGSAFSISIKRHMTEYFKKLEMENTEMESENNNSDEMQRMDNTGDESGDSEDECCVKTLTENKALSRQTTFDYNLETDGIDENEQPIKEQETTPRSQQKGYFERFCDNILRMPVCKGIAKEVINHVLPLKTRLFRAGLVHNFMRSLSVQQNFPISPFTQGKATRDSLADDFDGMRELYPTNNKRLCMVDAGLTFNSPYPLVLRPQRGVDIILSFDFSGRDKDSTPPFKEIKSAEKWAELNNIPFPPIDEKVFDREGMKELYIFKHPTDPHCPVVFHFVLANINFRHFKKPGEPRTSDDEKAKANFDIFDDPNNPYSTFNFKYTHTAFERLSELMEFNTLNNIEAIKNAIIETVTKKKEVPRMPMELSDVPKLRHVNQRNKARLSQYLSRLSSCRDSRADFIIGEDKEMSTEVLPIISEREGMVHTTKPAVSARRLSKKRMGNLDGLTSPREDEADSGDDNENIVNLRASRGRNSKGNIDGEIEDVEARCHSVDSHEENKKILHE